LTSLLLAPQSHLMSDAADLLPGFDTRWVDTEAGRFFVRCGGRGDPLLLLHGYPQTHVEWHKIAPRLAERYRVVLMDLRGYGASFIPDSVNGEGMTKRAMGADAVAVMAELGFERFHLVGHDRGGRVAYRLAFDAPERLNKLVVVDIIPTASMFRDLGKARSALGKYHWLFLAQPAPLPETLIGASAMFFLDHTLASWTAGRSLDAFDPLALDHYRRAFDMLHIHTTCECYRAGAFIDRLQDEEDLKAGRKITVPMLAMWGTSGLASSGISPLDVWREYARDVQGTGVPCGHFVPEENPQACLDGLFDFLG
jgi:haloacetate dehalogenase